MSVGDCDYWIVSSRNCGTGSAAPATCLEYFHRTSERDLHKATHEAFLGSIRPDVPVCFVIHGSYNWWRDVVTESRKINRWVRSSDPTAPLQVVFFTWPSDGNMPFIFPVDIAVLGRRASQHSMYLAGLIGQLPPEQPVCLLGHSHGARASVAAMHLLAGGALEEGQRLPPGYATPTHLRAVLIAAAIDHNWLNPGQRYGQALLLPEQVLLMRNSRDATLAIYPLRKGWGERAIGRNGLGLSDRYAMDAMGKKVVELDAAQFAGTNHSFSDYHERAELAAAIVPYVHFPEAKGTAEPYEPSQPIRPAKEKPGPGEPEPIRPAKRDTPVIPPLSGPRLTPTLETAATEREPAPSQDTPITPKFRILKINPKSSPAARETTSPTTSATGESAPESKPKDRNPFRLQLVP